MVATSRILLSLRGAPAVRIDTTLLALQPVDAALLAWLALKGATPRARLAELLWPDSDDTAARGALRQRLYKLRQTVGQNLVAGHQTLALAEGVAHDLKDADSLLSDLRPVSGGPFADWLAHERERLLAAQSGAGSWAFWPSTTCTSPTLPACSYCRRPGAAWPSSSRWGRSTWTRCTATAGGT